MVTSFQIAGGWLYILLDDGRIARKYLRGEHGWEKVELPEKEEELLEPREFSAGQKDERINARS